MVYIYVDAMYVRQNRLDVQLQYDMAALWDGEYVSVSPLEEVPAFTDSQSMDVDAALNNVFG